MQHPVFSYQKINYLFLFFVTTTAAARAAVRPKAAVAAPVPGLVVVVVLAVFAASEDDALEELSALELESALDSVSLAVSDSVSVSLSDALSSGSSFGITSSSTWLGSFLHTLLLRPSASVVASVTTSHSPQSWPIAGITRSF